MEHEIYPAREVPESLPKLYEIYRNSLPLGKQGFAAPKLPASFPGAPGLVAYQAAEPVAVLLWHERSGCSSVAAADFYAEAPEASWASVRLLVEQSLSRLAAARVLEIGLWIHPEAKLHPILLNMNFQCLPRQLLTVEQRPTLMSPPGGFILRPLKDLPISTRRDEMAEVLYQAYAGTGDGTFFEQFLTRAHCAEYLSEVLDSPQCDYRNSWIAWSENDQRVAGFALCYAWPRSNSLYLEQLAVDPQAKGRGLGRALVTQVTQALGPRGRRQVVLTVSRANARAASLYRSLGARVLDFEREYVRRDFGVRQTPGSTGSGAGIQLCYNRNFREITQ